MSPPINPLFLPVERDRYGKMIQTQQHEPTEQPVNPQEASPEIIMLKAKVATLEQLLAVQEETALHQSEKLKQTQQELRQKEELLSQAKSFSDASLQIENRFSDTAPLEAAKWQSSKPQGFLYDPQEAELQSWTPDTGDLLQEEQTTLPISIRGETIGLLSIGEDEDPLSKDEEALLQDITIQVAGALETAQLLQQIEERAQQLSTVAEVSRAAATILDPDKMLQVVVDLTKASFGLYHAHIYLLEGERLNLVAGAGDVGREMVAQGRSIDMDNRRSLVARAARIGEGVLVNDVTHASDALPNPLLPDTHSGLAVPLQIGDQLLGVLNVQADYINAFSQEDILIHTSLASQLAVALQNARLYSETRQRADRERLVNEISQKIQRAVTIEGALQTAARELGQAFKAKNTVVTLTTSNHDAGSDLDEAILVNQGEDVVEGENEQEADILDETPEAVSEEHNLTTDPLQ